MTLKIYPLSIRSLPMIVTACASLIFSCIAHAGTKKAVMHSVRPVAKASIKSSDNSSSAPESMRRAIRAAYRDRNDAFGRKDINDYMAFFAPDYVVINEHGERPAWPTLRRVFGYFFQIARESSIQTTILSVVPKAGGVIVNTKEHMEITLVRPADHQVGHIVEDRRNRDFWVRKSDGWQLKRTKQISVQSTFNGQPA